MAYEQGNPKGSAALLEKLDAVIIYQAATFGWRLVLSRLVHSRFKDWAFDPRGPELFERFGRALATSARILQKQEKPPITDPGLRLFKREMIRELRKLLPQLRIAFSAKAPSDGGVNQFRTIVIANPDVRLLNAHLESWLEFLKEGGTVHLVGLSTGARISLAGLFDAWRAWATGYEQETIRQKISSLPK